MKLVPTIVTMNSVARVALDVGLIVIASLALLWVFFVPIDALVRRLLRIERVRRFCAKSYTHEFRRYAAPGYKPLNG